LADDGFGVAVAQRLARRPLPRDVRVVDFGIRGFELAYALMDDYQAIILIDAVPRGGTPGTLYTIEPDLNALDATSLSRISMETHGMNPMKVFTLVKTMGGQPKRLVLVGCEPSPSLEEEERIGLSEAVEQSLDEAVKIVEELIKKLEAEQHEPASEGYLDNGRSRGHGHVAARP
jgi:hydrogenase maturation protease